MGRSMTQATPVWEYIATRHNGNVTRAAKALGMDRSNIHRYMKTAHVVNGKFYNQYSSVAALKYVIELTESYAGKDSVEIIDQLKRMLAEMEG
jgi:hypothetical protein